MGATDMIRIAGLLARTRGHPSITIGLIDGPVDLTDPGLDTRNIRGIDGPATPCRNPASPACGHGTFVAGILAGRTADGATGLCTDTSILVCPIFGESDDGNAEVPTASPEQLARAIRRCTDAGASLINISAAFARSSLNVRDSVSAALDHAASRGVPVIVAAGNHNTVGGGSIVGHPWAIPVVAYGLDGRPAAYSNLGRSIGERGIGAPGNSHAGIGSLGRGSVDGGTSAAAAVVSATVALLWSLFPRATPTQIRQAVVPGPWARGRSIVPPLLDGDAALRRLSLTLGEPHAARH